MVLFFQLAILWSEISLMKKKKKTIVSALDNVAYVYVIYDVNKLNS